MRLLLQFASHKLSEFRIADVLASVGDTRIEYDAADADGVTADITYTAVDKRPLSMTSFLVVTVENEGAARAIAARSILVQRVLELWCVGDTIQTVSKEVLLLAAGERAAELAALAGTTFKIDVQAAMHTMERDRLAQTLGMFRGFPLFTTSKVSLKEPKTTFTVIYDHTVRQLSESKRVFFGREIGVCCRGLVDVFRLNQRPYIGTTSMDAELSFIVANQARARPGALVLDPFVGTGSLLLACAQMGACTIGGDIDRRVLRGKSATQTHELNFAHYGLSSRLLCLAQCDLSMPAWRPVPVFDAIVGDPPYGVRAGGRKLGRRARTAQFAAKRVERVKVRAAKIAALGAGAKALKNDSVLVLPQTVVYSVSEACADLLALAGEQTTCARREI
jgi:tRNA G10  N-methylase Trm11